MKPSRVRRTLVATALLSSAFALVVPRVSAQDGSAPDVGRGAHIATAIAGCADCHGTQFAGGREFAVPGGSVHSANLTSGSGGIAALSDADLRRAIHIGIGADGRPLRIMPAREYAIMTDADLNDVVAFLRTLPPVDATAVPAASDRDSHVAPQASSSGSPVRSDDGAYLVSLGGCTSCHGARLSGALRPSGPAAPNISHDGIGSWTFSDFQTAMRSGKTPANRMLSAAMPWRRVGRLSDPELRVVYDYLESQSAPPSRP